MAEVRKLDQPRKIGRRSFGNGRLASRIIALVIRYRRYQAIGRLGEMGQKHALACVLIAVNQNGRRLGPTAE